MSRALPMPDGGRDGCGIIPALPCEKPVLHSWQGISGSAGCSGPKVAGGFS